MKREFDRPGTCGSCEGFKPTGSGRLGRCKYQIVPPVRPWCGMFVSFGEVDPHPMVTRGQRKCCLFKEAKK